MTDEYQIDGTTWAEKDSNGNLIIKNLRDANFDGNLIIESDGSGNVDLKNLSSLTTNEVNIDNERFASPEKVWNGSKDSNNPIIAVEDNSAASNEQYSPGIAPDPDSSSTVYCWVKSDELSGGETTLRLYKSTDDGDSFTKQSTTFGPSDSSATTDSLRNPVLLHDGSKWLLYYRCEGNTDDDTIRYASGADITSLTDQSELLSASDIQTDLSMDGAPSNPRFHDICVIDGTAYFYGVYSNTQPQALDAAFVATSSGLETAPTVRDTLFTARDFPRSGKVVGGLSVIKENGSMWMITMVGVAGSDTVDERETYALKGSPLGFDPIPGVAVDTGSGGSWDESWAYGGQFLKKQDGQFLTPSRKNDKIRLYYNGKPTDSTSTDSGEVGLIEFDNAPPPGIEPINITEFGFTYTSTQTETSDTFQGVGFDLPMLGEGYHALKLQAVLQAQASGDTAEAAVETLHANLGQITGGKSVVSRTGSGFRQLIGDASKVEGDASSIGLQLRETTDGTAELAGVSVLLYDKPLREGTVR